MTTLKFFFENGKKKKGANILQMKNKRLNLKELHEKKRS